MKHKLIKDTGLVIGARLNSSILEASDGTNIEIFNSKKNTVVWFVSMYCQACLDLIPIISELDDGSKSFIVISDGDNEENISLATYYDWSFPVIGLKKEVVIEIFEVIYHPFVLVVDTEGVVLQKGEVRDSFTYRKVVN